MRFVILSGCYKLDASTSLTPYLCHLGGLVSKNRIQIYINVLYIHLSECLFLCNQNNKNRRFANLRGLFGPMEKTERGEDNI